MTPEWEGGGGGARGVMQGDVLRYSKFESKARTKSSCGSEEMKP